MAWLQSLFGGESAGITLVLIVLGLAIALVLLFWVFRKIAGDNALRTGRSRQPRLSVTDAAVVDDKRRLVLVRRDNVEHLVMIGGPTDVVIEQNITRAQPAAPMAPPERIEAPGADVAPRQAPQPRAAFEPPSPPRQAPARPAAELQAGTPPAKAAAAAGSTMAAAALQRQQAVAGEKTDAATATREYEAVERPQEERPSFDHELAETLEGGFTGAEETPEAMAAPAERPSGEPPYVETPLVETPLVESGTAETPPVETGAGEVGSSDMDQELSEFLSKEEVPQGHNVPSVDTAETTEEPPPRSRSDSMEDEMQRLLDELASSKPN